MRLGGVLAAVVMGLALTGCGHQVDEKAWQDDVEQELGQPVDDWVAYRDVWVEQCDEDESAFGLFVAAAMDGGTSADVVRTNIHHACPDRLEDVEDTLGGIGDVQQACDIPASERDESQQRLAEAMGC